MDDETFEDEVDSLTQVIETYLDDAEGDVDSRDLAENIVRYLQRRADR